MLFDQPIKDFNRVIEVIQVLRKYRLEELIFIFQLKKLVPKHKRIRWEKGEARMVQYSLWERLRMALEELGPAFIKLGQVLSNRSDLLPDELLEQLEKLQSDVSPFEFETVQSIIETESEKPVHKSFKAVFETPLASASIGQVHKAALPDGRQVVVKVQRPGIKRVIERDISILKRIVKLGQSTLEKRFGFNNAMDFIEEFEKTLRRELQYSYEARNMRQFRDFYADYDNFYIPYVYHDLSTDRMLVMEYVKGCKITDTEQLKAWGLVPEVVAESGMDIYLTQMFEYGYFHADPHPGNIIIRQDGVICLIDFGMVGRLTRTEKYAFANMLISMSRQDPQGMANHFRKLAISDQITNRRAFEADLNELIEDYAMLDISETNIAEIAMRIQAMIYKYQMVVPSSLFLLLRALTILEGVGKTVHPTFNTYEYLQPYGKKLMMERV
ncbi:MAG: AarF/ABC1/UbiB kinase family protein, partial [Bacteroidota bacterium]